MIKRIGLIILCLVISGVCYDAFQTLTYKPRYMSSMKAILKSSNSRYSQLEQVETYSKTLQYIFNGQVVKNEIMAKLETNEVNMTCRLINQSQTNIVSIQVIAPTKKEAYYSLKYLLNWYQNNAAQYHLTYEINILEDVVLHEDPIDVNDHQRNFLSGASYCLIMIFFIINMIVYFKPTIKQADDIEKLIDCRLFAKIPKERKKIKGRKRKEALLISSIRISFYYKESIKKLRNRFEISSQKHGYQSIMITSTIENEGKSTLAANLAISLAQSHHKVLLIDADIRKPSLHKIFSISQKKNINQYFYHNVTWKSQIQYIENDQLFVLCAKQDLNLDEKLLEDRLSSLIKESKNEFDYIIIDVSPLLGLDEPMIINTLVDASFLIVKQNEATVQKINDVISRLVQSKNNLIGCIYNDSIYDMSQSGKVYGYRYGQNRYSRDRGMR